MDKPDLFCERLAGKRCNHPTAFAIARIKAIANFWQGFYNSE
jgi:hypothetical protein